jgi:hypothetical protein
MFDVRVLMYCGFTVFGSYHNFVSKDGKLTVNKTNKDRPLTHYMLCQTNRLIFSEQYTTQENPGQVTILFKEQVSPTTFESHELTLPTTLAGKNLAVYVNSIDSNILVWSDDNDNAISYPTFFEALSAIVAPFQYDETHFITRLLNLEVLYVGQTEITNKYLRIDGHEKFAKAADDVIRMRPHKEIFVKLLNFDDPTWIVLEDEDNGECKLKKIKTLAKTHDHPVWITLFEASLIHHLQPYLNVHFKKYFPSTKHKGYKNLLNIGVNSANVVIDETKRSYCTKLAGDVYTRKLNFEFPLSL